MVRLESMPAEPLAYADRPEPAGAVERHAGGVLGKDTGLERPDAVSLGPLHEGGQQSGADTAAARGLGDVHAVLGDAGVRAAVGDARQHGPSHHAAGIVDRHQPVVRKVRGVEGVP